MVLEVRRAARRPPSHRSISPSSDSHLFIAFFAWLPSPQATMICIDNSEWMRNGDYSPSRFQAQADAVNLICGAKTQVRHRPTRSIRAALVVCDLGFWAPDLTVFFFRGPLQSNPENTVGVMTMAGKGVRVLVTPTSDLGKILACMHGEFPSTPYLVL